MIAIVTDKPNVGREIARVLGAHKKENGYMSGNGYKVTWTFGNMLSLAMPKDYGVKNVEREDFPLCPKTFQLMPKHVKTENGWIPDVNAVIQLKVIAGVLAGCDSIIVATDASREGELLFRYLYQYLGCTQSCHRLWLSSLTDEAIRKGMANLYPCSLFDNMYLAADSRNKADWLLGMNASYAVCKATGFSNNSLGRVQTPVLAAVCTRYRERENHIVTDSWPVYVNLSKEGKILRMRHVEEPVDRQSAQELYQECKKTGYARITAVCRKIKEVEAPALYNLTELLIDANRYHNLTTAQVMEITQTLYEKKLISYPRTSGRFLTEDVFATLPSVMKKISDWREFRPYVKGMGLDLADLPRKVVDEDRATEHPPILVTGIYPENLNREEMQVYALIVGRMLEITLPPCKVEYTTVDALCSTRKFRMRTCRIIEKGWLNIFGRNHLVAEEGWLEEELPELIEGELLRVTGCNLIYRKSLPVSPLTDAELVGYMDDAGLGTVATRPHIIRTLMDRKYIRYSGKYIIPTPKGMFVYETMKGLGISEASLTSGWEIQLARMEQGKLSQEEFLDGVLKLTGEITDEIFNTFREKDEEKGTAD